MSHRRKATTGLGRTVATKAATVAHSVTTPAICDVVKTASTGRASVRGGQVVGPLPLYLQIQRIGGNLTPHDVSSIIRDADLGWMFRLIDLANEARQKDCHLQSVLSTREMALASLNFQIIPYKDPQKKIAKKRDQDVADWVDAAIRNVDADYDAGVPLRDFRGLVEHLTGACYAGYAVAETLFEKSGKYLVPLGFSTISPRRFKFDMQTGGLQWWDQGMAEGVDLRKKHPGRFIQCQPRINGDVPCREGLVRPLMWAALFRNWTIRDWLALGELAWKPIRTGTYKKGASSEDIDALTTILENLTSANVAVFPETVTVAIEWAKANAASGSSGTHSELASFLASEMSKAVLGQTLTTEQGQRGSQALGRVHDRVRMDVRQADATSVASAIRRDLIAPLVRMNFGADTPVPTLLFMTQDAVDLAQFGDGVSKLVNAGLEVPAAWVRDQAGMPHPDDDDEILVPPKATPPTPPQDPNATDGNTPAPAGAAGDKPPTADTQTPADPATVPDKKPKGGKKPKG